MCARREEEEYKCIELVKLKITSITLYFLIRTKVALINFGSVFLYDSSDS